MNSFINRIKDWFSFDLRSLALYRILLSSFIICDLFWRLTDLNAHYTDFGIIPRLKFLQEVGYPWSLSFHLANGSEFFAFAMLAVHMILAFMLLIGFKTKWAAFGVYIMTVSLHNRNWYINNGGDDILRSILFISMFLPWGHRFSIDKAPSNAQKSSFSAWGAMLFLQAFVIYFFSYILKNHPIWRSEYSAIYYASHLDIFATPIGLWLRGYSEVMKGLTIYTIFIEYLCPLLLVFGVFFKRKSSYWIKFAAVLGFMSLHIGIILTMYIGLFPFYCLAMWTAFIPSEIWNKFGKKMEEILSLIFEWGNKPILKMKFGARFIFEFFGTFMFVALLMWNLTTLKILKFEAPFWAKIIRFTHLYQEWNMFSPYPKQDNIWIEVPAEFQDGSTRELITGDPDIYLSKKEKFFQSVPNEHWRKFYLNLSENAMLGKFYAGYLCRKYNQKMSDRNPSALKKISIDVYSERNLIGYLRNPPVKKNLWTHWCSETEFELEKMKNKNMKR
jgi:uncharacterized membrane protein YphA (DoxX/SURF4 family)